MLLRMADYSWLAENLGELRRISISIRSFTADWRKKGFDIPFPGRARLKIGGLVRKIAIFLALSAVSVLAQGFGIYAEGPSTMTNYGIIYSAGIFGIKNGYSYSNSHSETKNDSMKTSESDFMSASVEISPMLILNANLLNVEIAPAYQFSIGDSKTTSYFASPAGSTLFSESKPVTHAFKLNFLLTKVFAEKYKLGVGTNVFRYNFGDSDNESKTSTAGTATKSTTHPRGYSDGSLFYIHLSVYFI
jgi:hypothetical protein